MILLLHLLGGIIIDPVQVGREAVHPIVSLIHSIGIDHGHDHPTKQPPQQIGPGIPRRQKPQHAHQGMRGRYFSRVHPTDYHHHWLIDFQWAVIIREEILIEELFVGGLEGARLGASLGYGEQIHD